MPRRWSWRLRGDSSTSAISCTISLGTFQLERPPWDGVTWEGVCVCSDGRKTFVLLRQHVTTRHRRADHGDNRAGSVRSGVDPVIGW